MSSRPLPYESRSVRKGRYKSLFATLDRDKKGFLNAADIRRHESKFAQQAFGLRYAQELIRVCDTNRDGTVDFNEFAHFLSHKEDELLRMFTIVDSNKDGEVEPHELLIALKRAGTSVILTRKASNPRRRN